MAGAGWPDRGQPVRRAARRGRRSVRCAGAGAAAFADEGVVAAVGHRLALIGADAFERHGLVGRARPARRPGLRAAFLEAATAIAALLVLAIRRVAFLPLLPFAVLPFGVLALAAGRCARCSGFALLAADIGTIERGKSPSIEKSMPSSSASPSFQRSPLPLPRCGGRGLLPGAAGCRRSRGSSDRQIAVVFGLDAIPVEVGILRHLAILFEQLRALPRARLSIRLSCWPPPCGRLLPRPRRRLFPRLLFNSGTSLFGAAVGILC
jgi:hypothetical protein